MRTNEQIARNVGTPCYIYDLESVVTAHADLTNTLPQPSTLYYSLKANPHPLIVAALAELGCRAEVSSKGEIDAAVEGGVPGSHILLTGPGKSEETIDYALSKGVRHFSVDSPVDLDRTGARAYRHDAEVECLLRVNADNAVEGGTGLTMTGTPSQFGADASWIFDQPHRFQARGSATVTGLHLYMGTNLTDEDTLVKQFDIGIELAKQLGDELGGGIKDVDLGGGFGAPYAHQGNRPRFPNLRARLTRLLDERLPTWRSGRPRIAFESGRYLVADSGTLVSRVVDMKKSKDELFVVLDTGVNHLGGMSGLRRIPRVSPDLLTRSDTDETMEASVVGPLCTPLDTLGRDVEIPSVDLDDLLTVPNVGAYGLTASLLGFLGHRAPVEVVVRGDEVLLVSQLKIERSETEPERFFDDQPDGGRDG